MSSGGSSGGGGGGSGKISWPGYFMDLHERWLDTGITPYDDSDEDMNSEVSMEQALWEAWDNSPFAPAYTFDPSSDLADVDGEFEALDTLGTALAPETDYASFVTKAVSEVDSNIIDDSTIAAAVTAFEARKEDAHLRNVGRFAAGMADLNAIATSSFVIGLAGLERDFAREVTDFNAKLTHEGYQMRNQLIGAGIDQLFKAQAIKTQVKHNYVAALADYKRTRILAEREFLDRDLELAVKDSLWNIEIWQTAGNLLASAQGGVTPTRTQEQGSKSGGGLTSMLGGAMGGAGTGAAIGTALGGPGIGTAIGALVGGAMAS